MIDVCLPFNDNFPCLRAAARGIQRFVPQANVLLHVQRPEQRDEAAKVFFDLGVPARVVTDGTRSFTDMCGVMDDLFEAATGHIVVMMEQDTFLISSLAPAIHFVYHGNVDVIGPVDTLFYNNRNAIDQPLYNTFGRMSPQPGYMHSSLMVLNRKRVIGRCGGRPFRLDPAVKLWGTGLLGAEAYYGICQRYHEAGEKSRLAFMLQEHASVGLAAEIVWQDTVAIHLYFSSTRQRYVDERFMSRETVDWLAEEEKRFLDENLKGF